MAKVDTQNIPAELLDAYRGILGEERPNTSVGKRYPYRIPTMQSDVGHPSPAQRLQRERFIYVSQKFNTLSWPERQRWYTAAPPWGSFLWYYNYFLMSGLMDVLGANSEGASMITSIKHYTFTMLAGAPANINVVIDAIAPAKAMVFPFGAGYKVDSGFEPIVAWAWIVYPYVVSIAAELVVMRASSPIEVNAACSISVVEYI